MRRVCRLVWLLFALSPSSVLSQDRNTAVPNMYGEASEELIQSMVSRQVDQVDPIYERDGDTTTVGTARAIGAARAVLIPDSRRAMIHIVFEGTVYADVTISQKPVKLFVSTLLPFKGGRPAWFDEAGMNTSPSWVCGRFGGDQLHCITTNFRRVTDRVVRRFAKFIYNRQKDEKLQEALPDALRKILEGFDKETVPELRKLNEDYNVMLKAAKDANVDTQQILYSTTADRLFVKWVIGTPNQPRVTAQPPQLVEKRDLAVKIHQNVINEVATANIAGRDITIKELQKIFGPLAETLKPDPEEKPWRIRFAKKKPLEVTFDKQKLKLVMRTLEIASDTKSYNRPMDLHVEYRIVKSKNEMALVRVGRVDPRPPWFKLKEGQNYPARIQTARSWIRRNFEETFEARMDLEPIKMTGALEKVGELAPTDISADNGWIAASWERRPANKSKVENALE